MSGDIVQIALFLLFAAAAVGGALMVVTARDPFVSALSLIVNFVSLGALYLLLHSPFVAIAQIIVYAGAVVVLFLFVLAYLGDQREITSTLRRSRWVALGAPFVVIPMFALLVYAVIASNVSWDGVAHVADDFASPEQIGEAFMTKYLLPFEATSIILLVAAIGGVVLGLTGRERHDRLRRNSRTMSADEHKRLTVEELRELRDQERAERRQEVGS